MTAPVIAELAWALTRAGHATMRFDYRGVGASQGRSRHAAGAMPRLPPGELEDERADLFAAGDQLLATTAQRALCAVGYSFGAAVVLSAAEDPRIERLVLVAPPTTLFDLAPLASVRKPLLVVAGHRDPYVDRAAVQGALPPGATFEVMPHADHAFSRGLTELGKLVTGWLRGDRPEHVALPDGGADASSQVREIELDPGAEAPLELDLDR
jgi:alpha/beta superfamily hydrolase